MRVSNVLINQGRVLLYCVGNDISANLNCNEISIQGKHFNVIKTGVYNSISNVLAALMQIDAKPNQDIPLGEITVIN